jgi:rRNA processing protein Krr1/Pno1
MGLLVNAAIAALAGSVGAILAATVISPTMSFPFGLLFGVLGFFLSKQLVPAETQATVDDFEARQLKKQQRKQKVAEKAKREREEAEAEAEQAAADRAAEKAAKQKKKLAAKKKAAQVVDSDSESEQEEVVDTKNLSKSAQKKLKAKAKAKAAEDASSKLTEAQKKKEKEKAKAKAKADADKASKAEAKLRASIAADTEGWNTIESTKPAKKAGGATTGAGAVAATTSTSTGAGKSGKQAETPSSERPLTIELIVPTKQHALLIGPKGATLQQIQAGSGATIDMPKRETASSKINITGTPAQVAAAKNSLESLIDRGFSTLTHPGILSDEVTVDPKLIGLILGKNAETLRTIQTKTNTRINLPDKGTTAKIAKITIVGEKDGVKLAKATLKQLITDGYSPLTHEGYVKVDIVYPKERLGLLIGPNGQTIKSIQGNTKTRINIPDKTSNSQYVSVVGQPAGVAQAEKEILRLLEPPAPIPEPEEADLATEEAWGQQHTAQGEDALWE